jgi:hypothetical protein
MFRAAFLTERLIPFQKFLSCSFFAAAVHPKKKPTANKIKMFNVIFFCFCCLGLYDGSDGSGHE